MTKIKENINPNIDESWKKLLAEDFGTPEFLALKKFLKIEKATQKVYPPGKEIFTAFNLTPVSKVKAVIIGQDPYHGEGQAHGLCFSVQKDVKVPPSLKNIYKELKEDIGMEIPSSGNLEKWAKQGVLLLNATLTVRANQAGSHQGKGWESFTDEVIRKISKEQDNVSFLLWGKYAQAKEALIDNRKHLILKAAHPSPFSAYNGFFGCKHFTKTNQFLRNFGIVPIDWDLND